MYFMQKGTPFIYQGQEIGMVNADYTSAYDYRDLPTLFSYEQQILNGMSKEEVLRIIKETVRDNSRTPMQWENTLQAGFTTGKAWININQNF